MKNDMPVYGDVSILGNQKRPKFKEEKIKVDEK